ncbi:hypothetical protein Efla_004143 [Eimeria flavescens]
MARPAGSSQRPPSASSAAAPSPEPPLIGKRELLEWISAVLGDIGEDVDFSTLRFGHVYLRLFELIWPQVLQSLPTQGVLRPENPADVAANWELIEAALQQLQVPLSFVNQPLIRAGNFAACYQSLVFLFFLYCLARDHECEFVLAHAVDAELTAFMSSEAPLACLVAGGAVDLPRQLKEKILTPRTPAAKAICTNAESPQKERGLFSTKRDLEGHPASPEVSPPSLRREGAALRQASAHQQQQQQYVSMQRAEAFPRLGVAPLPPPFAVGSPPLEERPSSASAAQQPGVCSPSSTRVVGGAFASDGSFSAGHLTEPRPEEAHASQQKEVGRRDANVQTQTASPLEAQGWQLPPSHAPLDWCGEGQKIKGEQLLEVLRYQNDLLKQQLGRAAEEAAATRRQHEQQLRDLKEAAAVELQRAKEKANAALLDQQAQHASAIQSMRHQLDMRIRQIEDDVTIDIEVLCSSSSGGSLPLREEQQKAAADTAETVGPEGNPALAKVKKLQELMEERLRAREAAASELKQLLQETLEQCAAYRRDSDSRWAQWRRCEELREALMQLLLSRPPQQTAQASEAHDPLSVARQTVNEELQRLLDSSGFLVSQFSALEQKLLAALVESVCVQQAQHARHRQEELELTRLLHQAKKTHGGVADSNGNIATMQKELLLEEQVRRLEAQNQRLVRTSEYLRLKVEHLAKWKAEDDVFARQCQGQRRNSAAAAAAAAEAREISEKREAAEAAADADIKEQPAFPLPAALLQQSADKIGRDAELLFVLKSLGRGSDVAFTDLNREGQELTEGSGEREGSGAGEGAPISISAATKKRLLQLFWLLLGDFYKFTARLSESRYQLKYMQELVRTVTKEKVLSEQAAAKEKTELICSFEKRIQSERSVFQKLIGRNLVKLLAAQEQVEVMQKMKNKQEDEHEALLQVLHQADNKRFNTILAKLHSVEMANRVMQKREQFWNELAKALSTQLSTPSEKTQQAIQDLWSQLMGSKALIASGIMELSSDNLALQLSEVDRALKDGECTPRSTGPPRSARSSVHSSAAKLNPKRSARLMPKAFGCRDTESCTTTPKNAAKPNGSRPPSSAQLRSSAATHSQQPAGEADGRGPADAFERCLRDIRCNVPSGGDQGHGLGRELSSLSSIFKAMQTASDSEDEASGPGAALTQQLFLWQGKGLPEGAKSEMPKDWVNLLKLMAQEATALFKKHKSLIDKEVEELKKDKDTQLEKRKKLMLQLSDQQAACSSFREQQDFFRRQHELALEALERVQEEKAHLAASFRELEDELRNEAAELRTNQTELKKIISAIASQAADSPAILALCSHHISAAPDSHGKPADPQRPPLAAGQRPQLGDADLGKSDDAAESPQTLQQMNEANAQDKQTVRATAASHLTATASSSSARRHPELQAATDQQHRKYWKNQASPGFQRSESTLSSRLVDTRATTETASEWLGDQPCASTQGSVAIERRESFIGRCAPDRPPPSSSISSDFGGVRTALPSARPRLAHAELFEDAEDVPYISGKEESNRVASTTLPSPRSPPKAARAPLVSPSRLVHALRMQMLTPKTDQSEDRQTRGSGGGKEDSAEAPANAEHPRKHEAHAASYSFADSYLHRNSSASQVSTRFFEGGDTRLRATGQSKSQSDSVPSKRASAENVQRAREQRSLTHAEIQPAGDLWEDERHGGFKTDRSHSSISRAAAEQAWEDFVGAYGSASKKQSASPSLDRRVDRWNPVKMAEAGQRGASGPEGESENDTTGPDFRTAHRAGLIVAGCGALPRNEDENGCCTRETTDSALQDVLNIEQELRDEEPLGDISNALRDKLINSRKGGTDEAFGFEDSSQLAASASTFLRRLGTQLGTRMRVSSSRPLN